MTMEPVCGACADLAPLGDEEWGGCAPCPLSDLVGARLWDRHDTGVPKEVVVGSTERAAQCQGPAGDIAWTF